MSAEILWADDASVDGIATHIVEALANTSRPVMAVPGGQTPLPVFAALASAQLDWSQVTMMLTDDRIVAADHPASNQRALVAAFAATDARIIPLEQGMGLPAFDLVWLGMGKDGHIASLFPNMQAEVGNGPAIIRTLPEPLPPEAPFARLSLNLAALTRSRSIMLVLKGAEKKMVIDQAIAGENDLPIAQLLRAASCPVTIFWSEK
ncbi:MAG: 6-phosphogluconolactonase [Parasphingorhabdus sp.]|nr:6-phosphogluconolactonase [Parasphingorhabdus sp.]